MDKIWVNKAKSFSDASDFDNEYYRKMSPEARLSELQELRENSFIPEDDLDESRKGFRRSFRIIKYAQS